MNVFDLSVRGRRRTKTLSSVRLWKNTYSSAAKKVKRKGDLFFTHARATVLMSLRSNKHFLLSHWDIPTLSASLLSDPNCPFFLINVERLFSGQPFYFLNDRSVHVIELLKNYLNVRDQILGIGTCVVINDENVFPIRRRVETVGRRFHRSSTLRRSTNQNFRQEHRSFTSRSLSREAMTVLRMTMEINSTTINNA